MNLPQKVYDNVVALHARFPLLSNGSEDDRRELTRKIAEQNCFDLGSDWGTKSTSSSSPQSKDAIAFKKGNAMDIWDWQNGTTRAVKVVPDEPPHYPNVSGQFFIKVQPVNHLSSVEEPPDEEDDEEFDQLKQKVAMQGLEIVALKSSLIEFKVQLDELKNFPPLPVGLAKKGDAVEVKGSISFGKVLSNSEVTWKGKIL